MQQPFQTDVLHLYTHKMCSSVSVIEMYPCLLILTFFDYLNFTIRFWPHICLFSLHKWNFFVLNDYQKTDECFNINKYQYYNVCTILLHLKVSVFLYLLKKTFTSTLFALMLLWIDAQLSKPSRHRIALDVKSFLSNTKPVWDTIWPCVNFFKRLRMLQTGIDWRKGGNSFDIFVFRKTDHITIITTG